MKTTYAEIQRLVKVEFGCAVKTCWIAHVKEINGLPLRVAPNRQSLTTRKVPCPAAMQPKIESVMRDLGVLVDD